MSKIDLIIFLIILVFMLFGYYKGLVKSILSVVQYFLVIILSISLAPTLSKVLMENFNLDLTIIEWIKNNEGLFVDTIGIISEEILRGIVGRLINVASVIILFIGLKIITSLIIVILNKIANLPIISVANKLGGLILGAFNGILVVYLIILLLNWLPLESINSVRSELNSSLLGAAINAFVPEVAIEVISLVKISG